MKKTFEILCIRNGLKRKDAAVKAGFSPSNFSDQMKREAFNFEKLKGLAVVFNMSLSELAAIYDQEEGQR